MLAAGACLAVLPLDGRSRDAVPAFGRDLTVPAAADTFVIRERPDSVRGSATVATTASWPDWHTEGYFAFTVPAEARGFRSARLELTLDRLEDLPDTLELRELPGSWTEGETAWSNRPVPGASLGTVQVAPGQSRVTVDVSRRVTRPGSYAFAVLNTQEESAARFRSRESGFGPRLVLSGADPVTPVPGRPRPASPTPAPEDEKEPVRTRPPSPEKTERSGGGLTACGVSLEVKPGQTHLEALREADQRFGGLEMIRDFFNGPPRPWPGRFGSDGRPTVTSFKLNPRDVLAGEFDDRMAAWFQGAPRDRDIYWVFYHEPEDDIARGAFSAADYRAAWRRLRDLADRARNPRLKATLVLMGWSTDPKSSRDWRDYYPGRDVIQVLGWDVYNLSPKRYQDPAEMFGRVVSVSRAERLPFGIAETGSYLIGDDDGQARARWLTSLARYLTDRKALWVAYFDLNWPSGDFRLRDAPSSAAWRGFC